MRRQNLARLQRNGENMHEALRALTRVEKHVGLSET